MVIERTPPHGRRGSRRATKSYASENDVVSDRPAISAQKLDQSNPETPQKDVAPRPIPVSSSRRSKGKKPAPQISTSPECEVAVRPATQPPPNSAPAKPVAVFAGVFAASPAASSLRVPSFLKPAPSTEPASNQESGSSAQESPETITSRNNSLHIYSLPGESPLDRIFRADREEKARARTKPSVDAQVIADPPLPSTGHRPGITLRELDGALDTAAISTFSIPYQQRLFEAKQRSSPALSESAPVSSSYDSTDRAEALKRYLWGGEQSRNLRSLSPQKSPLASASPSSLRLQALPLHPAAVSRLDNLPLRSPDLMAMEDSLRRLLKLDAAVTPRTAG